MSSYRIALAWPGVDPGGEGLEVHVSLELVTSDECDGERVEMTESLMREVADMLRILAPSEVRFCAISPDKTSGDTREFPFTHHMVIEDAEWEGPRDWCVTLDECEDGDIVKPDAGQRP